MNKEEIKEQAKLLYYQLCGSKPSKETSIRTIEVFIQHLQK